MIDTYLHDDAAQYLAPQANIRILCSITLAWKKIKRRTRIIPFSKDPDRAVKRLTPQQAETPAILNQ